ncbi:hypothetical protein RUM44_006682 [Polyplax serrata]|uniref:Diphthine--ammonia ligase n=1 Tax=Polyplax serrata TaxID=468196 RepID=A0ABR1AIS6_POLSC
MKLVALISGGKDSIFNMLQCIAAGHEIVALANIEPESKDELDSYMYQSVGHQVISLIASALELPIYRQKTKGKAHCKKKVYVQTNCDEVEDLMELLKKVKNDFMIEGISTGAIASDYQRTRVENVCSRLGLKSFAYLWRRNQAELLQEMIDAELDAIILKVACIGLTPDTHLGMHIRDLKQYLLGINEKYGVNVCGEGGEYETLTVDCPLFHKQVVITESENVILSNDAFAPVAFLNIKNASLKQKFWETDDPIQSLQRRLAYVKSVVKDPYQYIEDCVDDVSIFPQHGKNRENDILPSPFEPKPDTSELQNSISEYWKSPSSSSRGYSFQHVSSSLSTMMSTDTSTCSLNYTSGWCSIGNVTGTNMQEAFACLQSHMDRVKYNFEDVVFVNLYLKDMSEFSSVNKLYCQYMQPILPPARVCVAVPLPYDISVLIVVVLHKFLSKSQKVIWSSCPLAKDVMHVQSISHWAPANIGPYSQCVRIGGVYYLAGQIPLIPGSMEILNKPIFHQCKLTLRHIKRILEAMSENLDFSNVFHVVCYVTTPEIAYDITHLWAYITQNDTAPVAVFVVSSLPKNAQLEFEVIACNLDNPRVQEGVEVIEEFSLRLRRCIYFNPYVSSFVCRVCPLKRADGKKNKDLTVDTIKSIVMTCLHSIRKDIKNSSHLCMVKLFYKANSGKLNDIIFQSIRTLSFDHKVVASGVPIVAYREPEILLIVTGVCH